MSCSGTASFLLLLLYYNLQQCPLCFISGICRFIEKSLNVLNLILQTSGLKKMLDRFKFDFMRPQLPQILNQFNLPILTSFWQKDSNLL